MAVPELARKVQEVERRPERHPTWGFQREIRDLFDRFFPGFDGGLEFAGLEAGFSPKLDVAETDKEIRVSAELPGVEEKDVDVSLSGGTLTIRGERRAESERKDEKGWVRREQSFGSFRRSIALPCEVDADKVAATFTRGILKITLPKAESAQNRRIAVKAG